MRSSHTRSSQKFAASFGEWHHAPMRSSELIRAEVNGYSVAYQDSGEGLPLVLLHGFHCDSRCWRAQLEDLSDRFRVVAWDAPGAGSSSDPPDPFTITDWAHCLAQFLDVIGIERAQVIGLSWGGVLAQEFYSLYPGRVLGLVLADTYAGWKGSLPEEACDKRLQRCFRESSLPPDEFVALWVHEFFTEGTSPELKEEMSEVVSDFHPLGFRLMAKSLYDTDTTDRLARAGRLRRPSPSASCAPMPTPCASAWASRRSPSSATLSGGSSRWSTLCATPSASAISCCSTQRPPSTTKKRSRPTLAAKAQPKSSWRR
jgi:pimeloyl-ACP methyl ester carboxylesterase